GSSLAARRTKTAAAARRSLAVFLPSWQGVDRHPRSGAGVERLREVLVPLQGLRLPADVWEREVLARRRRGVLGPPRGPGRRAEVGERDVLPRRLGAYSTTWVDQLCASGELVW